MRNMEKEIKLTITLEKANEYYNSGNEELKNIALLAYDEEILNPITYDRIVNLLFENGFYYPNTLATDDIDKSISASRSIMDIKGYFNTHDYEFLTYIGVYIKVKNMANYFNRDYDKPEEGYEILNRNIPVKQNFTNILFVKSDDAGKAYKLLTDDEKAYLRYLIV